MEKLKMFHLVFQRWPVQDGSWTWWASCLRVDDQVGGDTVLLQVGISVLSIPFLHLVRPIQVLKSDRGDVDPPEGGAREPGSMGWVTLLNTTWRSLKLRWFLEECNWSDAQKIYHGITWTCLYCKLVIIIIKNIFLISPHIEQVGTEKGWLDGQMDGWMAFHISLLIRKLLTHTPQSNHVKICGTVALLQPIWQPKTQPTEINKQCMK